jgi:hypothetical protein
LKRQLYNGNKDRKKMHDKKNAKTSHDELSSTSIKKQGKNFNFKNHMKRDSRTTQGNHSLGNKAYGDNGSSTNLNMKKPPMLSN